MSMTITSMAQNAVSTGLLSSKTTSASNDPVTKALDLAGKRIDQQKASADVQVSAFGKIKSGFADLQTSGKALSGLSKTATTEDISKAALNFVSSFNGATNAISSATKGDGKTAGALADNSRARVAGNDLSRSLSSGSTSADLKKIGITTGKDGTLSIDTKTFEAALKSDSSAVKETLAKVGGQVEKTATRELSGNVGNAVNSLTSRANTLATQQASQQSLLAYQQAAADATGNAVSGIAAYLKIFSV